jgi:hypothetical protein
MGSRLIGDHDKNSLSPTLFDSDFVTEKLRLTRDQGRFLMSELARKPNPDYAHQVLLAREIAASTLEQIQGWFAMQ